MNADIIIVGGGASGLMTALLAARSGISVMILEHKDKIGKKLLATGNGRCNYTNLHQSPECYHSENIEFVSEVLKNFDAMDTIDFFQELGIYPKSKGGYIYPWSEQAASVLDVFMMELQNYKVKIKCLEHVISLEPQRSGFLVGTETYSYTCRYVVLAAGGMAAQVLGSDGSGYSLAKSLGHTLIPVVPALVQLKSGANDFKNLSGIRTEGEVTLLIEGEPAASSHGEIQLTSYGISGIPVFQVSRHGARALLEKKEVAARIDFMTAMSKEDLIEEFKKRACHCPYKSAIQIFTGFFHPNLSRVYVDRAGIKGDRKGSELTEKEWAALAQQIKAFHVPLCDTNDFSNAQVTAGGIPVDELDARTMESKHVTGLFLTGEIVDVDGICGGYNLQWAWSSAYTAASALIDRERNREIEG